MGGLSYSLRVDRPGVIETTALVLGVVCIFGGVILLATRRRRMRILVLALCGTIPGGFLGALVAEAIDPHRHFKGQSTQEWFLADWMIYAGMALGALLTPLIVTWISRANRLFVEAIERDSSL
jgi:hypothetical protein